MNSASKRWIGAMVFGLAATLTASAGAQQDAPAKKVPAQNSGPTKLIPRSVLFGNPVKTQGRLSPDGKRLAFIAPVNGVLNVWVGPVDDLSKAKPVTNDEKRGIRQYFWAHTGNHIVFLQDKGGDENWRVNVVDLDKGATLDLTPEKGVAARIMGVSDRRPELILVGLNDRDPQWHDVYLINVATGEKTLVFKNSEYLEILADHDLKLRLASKITADGGAQYFKIKDADKPAEGFAPLFSVGAEDVDTTRPLGFNADGSVLYMTDSRGRDMAALFKLNLANGEKKLVLEDDKADISDILVNPVTHEIDAAMTEYDRASWSLISRDLEPDFMALRKAVGMGDLNITSRTRDDGFWIVAVVDDDGPAKTWLLNRGNIKDPKRKPAATLLFANRPELADQPLVKMHPVEIKTRDGLTMVGYLTTPKDADTDGDGRPSKPVPMVLLVHGGPWARDSWGLDPEAQWLANRGYAVLQVNFRGSTGFGKKFLNAANKEWAGKMHDDLLDAVQWAVDQKIADPAKVAIMGGSYGGYATLVGLTFTPDVFACGVDIVGPSNINTLYASVPPYWKPMMDMLRMRVGDDTTSEGKEFLESRSPLNHVEKITKPLLIGQGANDPRVKQAEADQIVKAMQDKKIPVMYVLYPDEGHGFARPENRMSFNAIVETFLAQHLGGRAEPIGDAMKNSSITIPAGAEMVPGLNEAMPAKSTK